MPDYTLTVIDTTQIQQYVFGSNRLAENVGASELVEMATRRWAYEELPHPHNLPETRDEQGRVQYGPPDLTLTIEANDEALRVNAELVYAGGGNTVLLFRTRSMAVNFTRRLTRRVLRDAPGLELVIAHRDIKWEREALAEVMQEVIGQTLARKKLDRQPSLPLLGLGVTAACRSTGLVASQVDPGKDDEQPRVVSREIAAKLKTGEMPARERLESLLPRLRRDGWQIPVDFDDLGRIHGEEGYLAVVHADGNGMGRRVADLAARYPTAAGNRSYITAMRHFSQEVEMAAVKALASTTDLLAAALLADPTLPRKEDYFPFRPIVFGGDDVTFVCNGRYGLALAARYLQAFEAATAQSDAFGHRSAHACAGVAIVKLHYPFARAYRLSEALCDGAKEQVRGWIGDGLIEGDASALDWQFAISGITGTLRQIRTREYTVRWQGGDGKLYARPLLLRDTGSTWRTWPLVEAIAHVLVEPDGEWAGRRNKVKALREALRRGPDAVHEFLHTYRLEQDGLPDPVKVIAVELAKQGKHPAEQAKALAEHDKLYEPIHRLLVAAGSTGWDVGKEQDARCVYFDPIEIMDVHTDLQAAAAERTAAAMAGVAAEGGV